MKAKPLGRTVFAILVMLGLALSSLSAASAAAGQPDLVIDLKAPQHVEAGGTYLVNASYSNTGTAASAADTWVEITLPAGTSFVAAKDRGGADLPPDAVDGNVLTWDVGALAPASCCGHIFLTLAAADNLAEAAQLEVQGEIGSSLAEASLDNNTAAVTSAVCDMAGSSKQAGVPRAKPGDVVTYTLTLRLRSRVGPGASSEREVTLTDLLPDASQVHFMGWVGERAGEINGEQNQLRWQGRVRAGEPLVLQYRLAIHGDVPPGTQITNRARLAWHGGEMEVEPVSITVYMTEDDHVFGPQGGQWQHQSGLRLSVPPDAVPAQTRFQYRPLFDADTPPVAPPGMVYAKHHFELNAYQYGEVHQFNKPITMTIPYQAGDVKGLDPTTLRLWYRAGPGEPWTVLGEPHSHQNGQISFTTDHFTEFALFARGTHRINIPTLMR